MNNGIAQNFLRVMLMTALLSLLGASLPVGAADKASQATLTVSPEVLKSKIKEVEATTSLDEASRGQLTELYRRALTYIEKASSYEKDAASFSQARKTAPAETEKLRDALKQNENVSPEETLKVSVKTPLSELEQQLQKDKDDLAAVEARLSNLKKQLEIQTGRPAAVRERLIAARKQRETITAEQRSAAPPGELAALTQARSWASKTQAHALSAEIRMLDQELLSQPSRVQLLQAEKDTAEYKVRFVMTRVRALEDTLSKRRLTEAEQVQQETAAVKEELKEEHPLVRELAEQNVVLGEKLITRALELESISAQDDQARARAKLIADELSTIRQKLDVAGLSQALGRVLMEQRRILPKLPVLQRETSQREQLIADSGLRQIQYAEERRRLRNVDTYLTGLMQNLPQAESDAIRAELEGLVSSRAELLDKAIATEASYLRDLGELDLAQRQLINVVETYDKFLGKRLLWIRSTEPVNLSLLKNLPQEIAEMLSPSSWLKVGHVLLQQYKASPLNTVLIIVLAVLTLMRRRFLSAVVTTGEMTGRIRTDSFGYTMQALGWTALASAPLPLLLLATSWQLSLAAEASAFSNAVAAGLARLAPNFLLLLFFADLSIPGGLVVKHFRWPIAVAAKLRREFRLLMALFLPAVFITIHSVNLDRVGLGGGLTMLAVLLAIGSVGLFVFRAFTPRGGVLADFLVKNPRRLLARLRPVWLGLLMAYIIGLLVLVLMGYIYTGGTLTRDLIDTVWVIYLLVLVRGLVVRWLLLVRRRLAFQALLERREQARAAREAEVTGESATARDEDILEIEEPEVDLAALDADSRKLLNTAILFAGVIGLWFIWSPVLPAFGILQDISLWSHTAVVNGVETVVPVTLADLALAIIVLIITAAAMRGLPALLEFMLLQRITITAGGRYTATTLLRYVIVGTGTVLLFNILGGDWSQIQWLVAALGVGIGFGLQEIVANFISGLIILFERPIRVGDTVTVGDTTGVVTRINIRATTITNWDRQELLVPNKEFITGRLLNWSLSDPIIRVVIPVGITYGSDVVKAMLLMKEAAEEHANVLKDPAPSVTFESFGDNALSLYLRAYLPSMENRIGTITDLHGAINRKFSEAGIVIAFPQRDVHLDTSQPLDVRLHRETDDRDS